MRDQLDALTRNMITRPYSAGSTILYQGEVPRAVCVLSKGVVRVFGISSQGDEQIVTYHVAGEFFPTSWVFSKAPSTMFFYEAVTDCEIAFVPKDEFLKRVFEDQELSRALIDYLASTYAASLVRVNALEQPKARQKLLYTMLYLCQRYGKKVGRHTRIEINLTHQSLAGLVGLTRETTATELNQLRKDKILTYSKQIYDVDLDRLLDLIDEDSLRAISIR